jgi:plasmid replication initiation protein
MKNQAIQKFDPETQASDNNVNMSNALARASQGLSLAEKRVIAMGLAITDSVPAAALIDASRNGWSVKIMALDYAKTFDVDINTAYEQLKEAGDKLVQRQVCEIVKTQRGQKSIKTNWCAQVIYHQGEGWVSIEFTRYIAPHLLALRSQFVTYKLKQAAALRSVYSWRLFECLQSWQSTGLWVTSIENFAHAMDVPKIYISDFGQLRRRVIEPAVAELILKSDLLIEWKTKKAGRKVTGLDFRFSFKDAKPKVASGKAKSVSKPKTAAPPEVLDESRAKMKALVIEFLSGNDTYKRLYSDIPVDQAWHIESIRNEFMAEFTEWRQDR